VSLSGPTEAVHSSRRRDAPASSPAGGHGPADLRAPGLDAHAAAPPAGPLGRPLPMTPVPQPLPSTPPAPSVTPASGSCSAAQGQHGAAFGLPLVAHFAGLAAHDAQPASRVGSGPGARLRSGHESPGSIPD